MTNNLNSNSRRRGTTAAGLGGLALASVLLLCGAGNAPIENFTPQGAMQADLNAGGHSVTNAATVNATNVATANLTAAGASLGTLAATNVTVSGALTATAFTLPATRVTNRAELDPSTIMPGIVYWLDAAKLNLANGTSVASVPDALGSGTSALQATSGSQPTYKVVGVNGQPSLYMSGTQSLSTSFPLSTSYDHAFTIVMVIQTTSMGGQFVSGTSDSKFFTAFYNFANGSVPFIVNGTEQTNAFCSNYLAPMVIVLSYDGTTCRIFINGVESVEQPCTTALGATTALNIGTATGAQSFIGYLRDFVVYNHGGTVAEDSAVSRWFLNHRDFQRHQFIWEGDSLTAGLKVSGVNGGLQYAALSLLGPSYALATSSNIGVPNLFLSQAISTEGNRTYPGSIPGFDPIVPVWLGTNDLDSGTAASTVYAEYASYCQSLRALGDKVIALTVLPRNDTGSPPAGFEAQRQLFNASVVANWASFSDALADVGDDPTVGAAGSPTNTTYYFSDQVHLLTAGYTVIAPLMANAILRVNKQPVYLTGTLSAGACTINNASIVPGLAPGQPLHLWSSATNAGTLTVYSFTLPTGGAPGQVVVHSSNSSDNDSFKLQLN